MYTTTLQFTRFQNITGGKVDKDSTMYGYRIYNTEAAEYCNAYESIEELEDDVNIDTVLEHIRDNHPEFYDTIIDDGGFFLNDTKINSEGEVEEDNDDEESNDNDDDDDTLLPDNSELPNGEPKFVINIDPEEMDDVEKIIEETANKLI